MLGVLSQSQVLEVKHPIKMLHLCFTYFEISGPTSGPEAICNVHCCTSAT